jgi:hypothetical protein
MRTEQDFWDEAFLAAVSNMAGRRDYEDEFPHMLVNDAERIADAVTKRRQSRLVKEKQSVYRHSDFTVSGSGHSYDEIDDAFPDCACSAEYPRTEGGF